MIWPRALCLLLAAAAAPAQDLATRLDHVVQPFADKKQFMGSVLVARGGDVLFSKAYGFADLEWDVPDTPATKYRLGSITKQFTAASILLLEERGKLSTGDLLKKHLPDAPAAWDKITIFHLLTHTSGIPSFTDFPDYRATQAAHTSPEQLVARFRDKPLEFQPGEKWNYSNSGYALLGYLVARISGQPYAQFLQENIFQPLGMADSGYDSNSDIIKHRAAGYVPSAGAMGHAAYIDMTIPYGAGGLYSTTEDLLRWERGLFGGKLLKPESLRKMTTPFKNKYACGLFVHETDGHQAIDHGGGIDGFNTYLAYYPDDRITIAVLANLNGRAPETIAAQLAKLVLEK